MVTILPAWCVACRGIFFPVEWIFGGFDVKMRAMVLVAAFSSHSWMGLVPFLLLARGPERGHDNHSSGSANVLFIFFCRGLVLVWMWVQIS